MLNIKKMLDEYNKFDIMRLVGLTTVNAYNISFSIYQIVRITKLSKKAKRRNQEMKEEMQMEMDKILGNNLKIIMKS